MFAPGTGRKPFVAVLVAVGLLSMASAGAAPTGYYDDFSGEMKGWAESNAYSLTQADGVLRMSVAKQTKWEGQYLHLGEKHDFSENPYVNLRVKSDTPCILHVYMHDGQNNNLTERKVRVAEDFVDLFYDLGGSEKLDLTGIQGLIFAVNGAANSWEGTLTLDELRIGDRARKMASIEGIARQVVYRDSGRHSVLLTGLDNVSGVEASGARDLVRDARVSPVEDGKATLSFAVVPGATGKGKVTVTALGGTGYADNATWFPLTVEDNRPPELIPPDDQVVLVGRPHRLGLSGIHDGNVAAEQAISFSVGSSNTDVLADEDLTVRHRPGSPHASVDFTAGQAGTTRLTLTLDDRAGGNSRATTSFSLRAVPEWNNPPTVDPVSDLTAFTDEGEQRVTLHGITDGDAGGQPITVTATSSDEAVVPNPIQVDYEGGDTAVLRFTPARDNTGTAAIEVTVRDAAGTPRNNGDRETEISFQVTTRVRPVTGLRETFSDWPSGKERWRCEEGIQVSHATVDNTDVLEVQCRDKITFGGLWFGTPDLDLSEYPYLTVDVKAPDELELNVYFYDGTDRRNSGASQSTTIPADQWTTITFDFSGEGQMETNQSEPLRADWITGVLFNFHPELSWPFTRYNGTLHFRNLRIGDEAEVPDRAPVCTVAPVPDQVHLQNAGEQAIVLTGVSDGADGDAEISASSSNPSVVPTPRVQKGRGRAGARLTYGIGEEMGRSRITVRAEAPGSEPREVSFHVEVLEDDPAEAATVRVDCANRHQRIHGFGTFSNSLSPELYAGDLGASAMRVGLIGNQIEPINDNSDPSVLHRGALNYGALNLEHYQRLKEAGVETFVLSSWSPPAWMKANLSLNYQQAGFQGNSDQTLNRLDYHQYEEFAESMVAAVRMFREEAGITLAAIGLQNEPAFHEPYPSAILDPEHFVELIKVVGRRFEEEGISTRLYMPEQVFSQTRSMHQYIDALNADPVAEKYCDIVATHGYDARGVGEARPDFSRWTAMWERAQQGSAPKEMWMTETYPGFRDWGSAFAYALYLYGSLEHGNIGLWTSWSIEGQLVSKGRPNPAFYVCSQFWRYIRPGGRRVSSSSSDGQVLATSCVNDDDHAGNVVSVLINNGDRARAVRLDIAGHEVGQRLAVTCTDRVRRRQDMGAMAPDELILLPPRSVTTVAGQ